MGNRGHDSIVSPPDWFLAGTPSMARPRVDAGSLCSPTLHSDESSGVDL